MDSRPEQELLEGHAGELVEGGSEAEGDLTRRCRLRGHDDEVDEGPEAGGREEDDEEEALDMTEQRGCVALGEENDCIGRDIGDDATDPVDISGKAHDRSPVYSQ